MTMTGTTMDLMAEAVIMETTEIPVTMATATVVHNHGAEITLPITDVILTEEEVAAARIMTAITEVIIMTVAAITTAVQITAMTIVAVITILMAAIMAVAMVVRIATVITVGIMTAVRAITITGGTMAHPMAAELSLIMTVVMTQLTIQTATTRVLHRPVRAEEVLVL